MRGDAELQFVVSVMWAEEARCWNVKVGLEVVGQVAEEDEGWRWTRGTTRSRALGDRMTAVLDLLQQVHREHENPDEHEEAFPEDEERYNLRYTDPTTGRVVVVYHCQIRCTACREYVPGSQVGMRRIDDLKYRSQPQCSRCRSIKRPTAV